MRATYIADDHPWGGQPFTVQGGDGHQSWPTPLVVSSDQMPAIARPTVSCCLGHCSDDPSGGLGGHVPVHVTTAVNPKGECRPNRADLRSAWGLFDRRTAL